jgi:hypothetical protein
MEANDRAIEEKVSKIKVEAELQAIKNYLKFAHSEEYVSVKPLSSKKDKEEEKVIK